MRGSDQEKAKLITLLLGLIVVCLVACPALARYSGGSGTAEDPYQIAAAADLILLGETPGDYDKHFILTADIDLGNTSFYRAVIAPINSDAIWDSNETSFSGVFDGDGHVISHLSIHGDGSLGLFGRTGSEAVIADLGLEVVDVNGTHFSTGGLVGENNGVVTRCFASGTIRRDSSVYFRGIGGLVGSNPGCIHMCYSAGTIDGRSDVGGLAGRNIGTAWFITASGTPKPLVSQRMTREVRPGPRQRCRGPIPFTTGFGVVMIRSGRLMRAGIIRGCGGSRGRVWILRPSSCPISCRDREPRWIPISSIRPRH